MPSRDFDGGLLSRLSFTLTKADALAYLYLPRPRSRAAKIARTCWFLSGGALTGMLPENLTGPPQSVRFIAVLIAVLAVQFTLMLTARALKRQWQAQRMIPHPRPAVFEEWTDCVAGTALDGPDENYLSPELIGEIVDTPTHIFILSGQTTITLPKRVVENSAAMVVHLRELAKGPYYFDP
ncbi:MAG: hypothetical protein ABIV25_08260 [Paracoccaceae bacterium]